MATTAQQVFQLAMNLADENNQATGSIDTQTTKEYKNRTLAILNVLRMECFPLSSGYSMGQPGLRPYCPEIKDFDSPIRLDDEICLGILPYGLAAHLFINDDPTMANFFQQRYEELLTRRRSYIATKIEPIDDIYGGLEYGYFSRW